jgi:tetratricopeptide (TPR) repeat protein
MSVSLTALVLCAACASSEPPGQAAPARAPEGISPLVTRAEEALAAGDVDAAIAAYKDALSRTPWNERLQGHLAAAYAERSRRERERGSDRGLREAEQDLRAACELRPDDPVLRRNLAYVLAERAEQTRGEESQRLRAEALALDPEATAAVPPGTDEIDRRLDLAHDLVERGEIEAGLVDLEPLWREHPDYPDVGRLYAQTLVRQGQERQGQGDLPGAAASFERAITVYRELGACGATPCEDPDVRAAHHDRIVTWIHADRDDEARAALSEAEAAGLRFPELRRALGVAP